MAWAPLFTAVLANLHGGFLALPVIVATAAWGTHRRPLGPARGGSSPVRPRPRGLLPAGLVESLRVGALPPRRGLLLSSGVTSLIEEYQPAPFGKREARVLEMVVLALMALPAVVEPASDRYQLAHILVWLHLVLTRSGMPLCSPWPRPGRWPALLEGCRHVPGFWSAARLRSVWIPGIGRGLLAWPRRGSSWAVRPRKWPFSALATLNRQPTASPLPRARLGRPDRGRMPTRRRSYVDDRFELFGKESILEYIDVLAGGPAWERSATATGSAWSGSSPTGAWPKRMLKEPEWTVLYRDKSRCCSDGDAGQFRGFTFFVVVGSAFSFSLPPVANRRGRPGSSSWLVSTVLGFKGHRSAAFEPAAPIEAAKLFPRACPFYTGLRFRWRLA